jgi:hypothetical protein
MMVNFFHAVPMAIGISDIFIHADLAVPIAIGIHAVLMASDRVILG